MYSFGDEEIEAFKKLVEKRKLFRHQGKDTESECQLFEKEFSKHMGVSHAVILSSGTNALFAALAAAGIGPGDEVIIPAYTFIGSASAVLLAGAIPIIANIDQSLGINPEDVKNLITPQTKAIMPVHMDGLATDLAPLKEICREHKLTLVEDVAQAMGGNLFGQKLGSIGDFGCYSLNENKVLSCGEGGIVISKKRKDWEHNLALHDGACVLGLTHKDSFDPPQPFLGNSMRVSEISGVLMRTQLKKLDPILEKLRERKEALLNAMGPLENIAIPRGADQNGECCLSLHLLFSAPDQAMEKSKALRENKILAYPVTARPAHACWQWMHLFEGKASHHPALDPFNLTEKKYRYHKAMYLDSIQILSSTLKYDLDLETSVEEYQLIGKKIGEILRS
ncbi:MAG: aminotransferase class I/II-fold pyridoxal phosphate-dependent enzyme [Halobacteriovoraceae bacterium]|jgi:dTDP-4-amino-4,6-dideoxygalactose transaminase|nr:aminotransferase class I/II-fold pyridoxal phosphate-dependent enzyme [Halobacteriovoraceae bacterium]MBT5094767.1 aminotransferase class I/II-fold pyridoxal phosphate-dependent enzyme [Halobacteriovoraceae bacterium]